MKNIWRVVGFFLGLGLIGACIEEGDASPLCAFFMIYLGYHFIFKGITLSPKEYDPIDFVSDDFDYRQ
jgi:hypothetical protein